MSTDQSEVLLDVTDLHVTFLSKQSATFAVSGLSFSAERGAMVGVVGETGSGKSTAVKAAIGLVAHSSSVRYRSLRYNGISIDSYTRRGMQGLRGHEIAYIGQNPFDLLHPTMRIGRQMKRIWKRSLPKTRSVFYPVASRALTDVGLDDVARVLHSYPHQLSGGMAQRVVIAMALMLSPKLLIADEPTTALDEGHARKIMDLLVERQDQTGATIILVSHDLSVVSTYCTHLVVVYGGVAVESGKLEDVLNDPAHPYTVGLIRASGLFSEDLHVIPGAPEKRDRPLSRCPFAARCTEASSPCFAAVPETTRLEDGHLVRCFLHNETSGA